MKITIFSEELRKCLNAAGLSDCGENDTWNYWYQRLMNAYNESVERQIMTEQAENAKLRELVRIAGTYCVNGLCGKDDGCPLYLGKPYCALPDRMRELGIEVGE